MNKAVMISIQPKWCELIASGKKTIEVRKTKPKIDTPFKCYIYCSQNQFMAHKKNGDFWFAKRNSHIQPIDSIQFSGKVIGEFVCDKIDEFRKWQLHPYGKFAEYEQENLDNFLKATCLTFAEVCTYRENLPYYKPLYGWHISQLKIYDRPKELREFKDIHTCFFGKTHNCYIEKVCKNSNYDCVNRQFICLTRPQQSWCYVEELKE